MVRIIFFLIIIIGIIFLQIFLSKKKNKWFGLIFPIIFLIISMIAVLSVSAFSTQGDVSVKVISSDGTVQEENAVQQHSRPMEKTGAAILLIVMVFALYNIPTAILLVIYFACREKINKRSLLNKMAIQDLE